MKKETDNNSTDSAEIEALITRIEQGQLRDGDAQLLARLLLISTFDHIDSAEEYFSLLSQAAAVRTPVGQKTNPYPPLGQRESPIQHLQRHGIISYADIALHK
jgi:hypothetical protein